MTQKVLRKMLGQSPGDRNVGSESVSPAWQVQSSMSPQHVPFQKETSKLGNTPLASVATSSVSPPFLNAETYKLDWDGDHPRQTKADQTIRSDKGPDFPTHWSPYWMPPQRAPAKK